jgi:hypothetical protein
MKKLIVWFLLGTPLIASEYDKVPSRTWGEWYHGRPYPRSMADFEWLKRNRDYMEWRTGRQLILPGEQPDPTFEQIKSMSGAGSDKC